MFGSREESFIVHFLVLFQIAMYAAWCKDHGQDQELYLTWKHPNQKLLGIHREGKEGLKNHRFSSTLFHTTTSVL